MKNLSFLVVLFAFFACKEDNTTANYVDFTMTLTGKNMAPATASAARGTVVAKYYRATRVLTYTITYEGLTPNAWHIHKGAVGVTGAVVAGDGFGAGRPHAGALLELRFAIGVVLCRHQRVKLAAELARPSVGRET